MSKFEKLMRDVEAKASALTESIEAERAAILAALDKAHKDSAPMRRRQQLEAELLTSFDNADAEIAGHFAR